MKEARRYVLVEEVEYWDCGNPDHRHRGKKSAEECIEKNEMTEDQYLDFLNKWESAQQIEDDDLFGLALDELEKSLDAGDGKRLNYKIGRVLDRAREVRREKAMSQLYGLPRRIKNILENEGYETLEQIRRDLDGPGIRRVPNLGQKGIEQIRNFLAEKGQNTQ